nr:MAG TPA: hypothetical protein [Caudoviricetes sp.]
MNRINRRIARKEAMINTIERLNTTISRVKFSNPNGKATFHKLLDQKDYIAQQIAEASYTEYWMKSNHRELERIFAHMDEGGCSDWVKWDIEQLAASRRRWAIATSKQIWLG